MKEFCGCVRSISFVQNKKLLFLFNSKILAFHLLRIFHTNYDHHICIIQATTHEKFSASAAYSFFIILCVSFNDQQSMTDEAGD